jgi:Fe-S-cluster-containing dehydrogenase component
MADMSESNEYLLHLLRTHLDDLRVRMHEEQKRANVESHYHYVVKYVCDKPGCSGVDPVLATYSTLLEEIVSIGMEFPHYIIPAPHMP